MEVLRIKRRIESETLYLPELRPLLGRDVEIIVVDENGVTVDANRQRQHASLLELADSVISKVPRQALDRLPTDGAEQHDHYLYGSAKREPPTT